MSFIKTVVKEEKKFDQFALLQTAQGILKQLLDVPSVKSHIHIELANVHGSEISGLTAELKIKFAFTHTGDFDDCKVYSRSMTLCESMSENVVREFMFDSATYAINDYLIELEEEIEPLNRAIGAIQVAKAIGSY